MHYIPTCMGGDTLRPDAHEAPRCIIAGVVASARGECTVRVFDGPCGGRVQGAARSRACCNADVVFADLLWTCPLCESQIVQVILKRSNRSVWPIAGVRIGHIKAAVLRARQRSGAVLGASDATRGNVLHRLITHAPRVGVAVAIQVELKQKGTGVGDPLGQIGESTRAFGSDSH